ncbi:MAG TPA: protein kinase [Gammaproteobacteria bacterium]|nr:protein kinase [Gammaproteobacteria bacterium]
MATRNLIEAFDLPPGRRIANRYEIQNKIGDGYEGEVYRIRELRTGIERAAKFFFPHRNPADKTSKFYAKKLHKLRQCPILIQYHAEEEIVFHKTPITVLISEYVEGVMLEQFVAAAPGRRLNPFMGLHLLYALVRGVEQIHLMNEYHGDLHVQNIIVTHFGMEFGLKLLDFYNWSSYPSSECRRDDLVSTIEIFYECIGGRRHYAKLPKAVKDICCGMNHTRILKKFKNVSALRKYLETVTWLEV